jgi:hypothetical protein
LHRVKKVTWKEGKKYDWDNGSIEDALMQLVREVGKERVHEVNNKQHIFLAGYSCLFPSRSVRITVEVQVKSACNLTQF